MFCLNWIFFFLFVFSKSGTDIFFFFFFRHLLYAVLRACSECACHVSLSDTSPIFFSSLCLHAAPFIEAFEVCYPIFLDVFFSSSSQLTNSFSCLQARPLRSVRLLRSALASIERARSHLNNETEQCFIADLGLSQRIAPPLARPSLIDALLDPPLTSSVLPLLPGSIMPASLTTLTPAIKAQSNSTVLWENYHFS
jgi:hypothetical protein